MSTPIEDYALIGDCETAALVARDGSVDWLCWPRFDSCACFAALLGTPDHGRWLIAPKEKPSSVTRAYVENTLVLETTFVTAQGEATLIDFMPPRMEDDGHDVSDLVRLVGEGQLPRRMARGGATLAHHAQGAYLSADRRHRGGAHDLFAREAR